VPSPASDRRLASPTPVSDDDLTTYKEQALLRPDDATVRFHLGRLLLERGVVDQAARELDMATSLDPTLAEGFLLLGRALRLKNEYDLAVAKLRVAFQLDPRLVEALIEEGICWDQRGFYERARQAYRRALELRPNDPTIYNNIGVSYFYQGDQENALKNYKKALALDPTHPQTNNNIAVIAAARGDYDLAFEYFSRALGAAAAHNNVGYLLLRAAKFDQAIKHLREAARLNPTSVTALANLEAALRMTGRAAEAEQVHAQYLKAQQAEAAARK
jgi:Flp pilus assembly protein TadD